MISLSKLRRIDPQLANIPDKELEELRRSMYETVELAYDVWNMRREGSKNPVRSLTLPQDEGTLST
jgi:hypothetical protein